MSFAALIILAAALGTDAFSLCVGIGLAGVTRRQMLIISVTVLVFHIFMPLAGWFAGEFAGSKLGRAASVIGALLLVYLGARMIWATMRGGRDTEIKTVNFTTWGLVLLGTSVSMDALSVGFTLGARQVNLLLTAGTIGIVAGAMTASGLILGRFVGSWVGGRAQLLGGAILVGIGAKLIF
ncbi:manganese efflux pump MntP family protein [Pelotomaculum propionicicum]|uniref:Putative manganese efflux pump MntP n=1 Tax=Pelotomaculum propionicicum TaxID=258475 RepID=A0A4Y7RXJ6_9FIRM|nr:manganese efflux pump MntP family protein [Pelotomaculum propionicicum]NLI13999.1 manganese efflux pump [Peptococcaceae bacterium]TEB13641.1 putative manganese efflux pump MntP [Pelotomaculum propionicicum]